MPMITITELNTVFRMDTISNSCTVETAESKGQSARSPWGISNDRMSIFIGSSVQATDTIYSLSRLQSNFCVITVAGM